MRKGWKEATLGDVADVIDPHPSHRAPPEHDGGVPFIGIGDVRDGGRTDFGRARKVPPSVLVEHALRYDRKQNLIGLGRVASIGLVVRLPTGGIDYAVSPTLAVLHPREMDTDFLFYYLQADSLQEQLQTYKRGSTRQSVGMLTLRQLKVFVPPLNEQKRIVDVVSSVDAYIDALQKQADTARTARNAFAEEAINSGFPTFQLSQIGRIVTGSTPSTKRPEYWAPAEVDFITPGDFGEQLLIRNASRMVSREGAKVSRALSSHSVLQVCIGATIGKVGYVSHDVVTNQQINSVVGLDELDAYFVSLMLSTNELQVNICDRAGTTTLPIISKSAWGELSIPWPDAQIRESISLLAKSVDEYILATDNAVADAKNLRSGLLSDLLSGEHEIPALYDSLLGA